MLLLAIETSGIRGSIALAEVKGPDRSTWSFEWDKKAIHSEVATSAVEQVLKKAGKTCSDLSHLAVNVGPGSFTGLRVGLNLARTLGFCLNLPIANFNSLELLCWKHGLVGDPTLVAIRAIQNFYYCGIYKKTQSSVEEVVSAQSKSESELEPFGQSAKTVLVEGETRGFTSELSAQTLVELASQNTNFSRFLSWESAIPLYIRGSEAEEKLRRGVLRP